MPGDERQSGYITSFSALKTKPEFVCLVPEKREELTTEGGLDVVGQLEKVKLTKERKGEKGTRKREITKEQNRARKEKQVMKMRYSKKQITIDKETE